MRKVAWGACAAALLLVGCKSDPTGPKALTAPTGVTVTLVSLTSVRIDWAANPSGEQVRSYNVLRNGTKIGEATGTTYTDFGLVELETYVYSVSANGPGTSVSSPSAITTQSTFTLPDLTGPRVLSSVPAANDNAASFTAPLTITVSEPVDPATVNGGSVKLQVTASGTPVTGTMSYTPGATTITFTPQSPLSPSTGYTLSVTTSLKDRSGNPLITPYTAAFTTMAPPDNTPPTVTSLLPLDGATDVPVNTVATATFSEAMNAASINTTSFAMAPQGGGATVVATVTYNPANNTATLTPTAVLANNTTYVLRVSVAVRDAAGNAMTTQAVSTFRTAPPVDNNPPTVTNVVPADGSTNVAINSAVQVTFSEAMKATSVSGTTVTLTRTSGGVGVAATVAYDAANNRATLTPSTSLLNGTQYTVTVSTQAQDLAGNGLVTAFTSRFTTIAADVTPPTVIGTQPANNATNVDPNGAITATFSEAMDVSTMVAGTISVKNSGTNAAVSGTVSYNNASNTLSFLPTTRLDGSTVYAVTVSTAAKDVSGNALAASAAFTFTTAATVDNIAPTVIATVPAANATNASITLTISATFSEPMNPATMTASTFSLKVANTGAGVAGTVEYNAAINTILFFTSAPLAYGTTYTMTISSAARDLAGNSLGTYTSSFTTVSPPPAVVSVTPDNRSSNVASAAPVSVTFSMAMNPASITSSSFFVRNRNTTALVPGTISYNVASRTATFTPTAPYANYNGYSVTVTQGATSLAGEPLGSTFESCFTPGPGTGTAIASMSGFWSGDTACSDIHWHIRLIQTGNTLTLDPACPPGDCQLSALNISGQVALKGITIAPLASVNGTVTGNNVTFTIVTTNGATFTFTGAFATAPGEPNPWLIGTISGPTLTAVGISFERQRL